MRGMSLATRLYVSAVVLLGGLAVVHGLVGLTQNGEWLVAIPLIVLALLAQQLDSPLHQRGDVRISVLNPIAIAAVLLLGPTAAVVTASSIVTIKNRPVEKLFNAGMFAIAAFVSGEIYVRLGGPLLEQGGSYEVFGVLGPWFAAALAYEVVNGLLLVAIVSLSQRVSPLAVWFGSLAESALPMFIYSIFGLLLAVVWSYVGPISAILVLAPLTVARWVFQEFSLRQEAYEATMRSLIKSVETKDFYTRGHSERVAKASVLIGRRSGMREDRVASLRYAGMLHDVGKLGVPTEVLQASGKLTEEQFEAIQQHPVRGREITKDLEFLGEAIEGIHLHHERIDGRGYPLGLKGSEIPEFARIIAVADAFDSMTTTRSYRGARTVEEAIVELRACKGSQFDPVLVEAMVEAVEADGWELVDTSQPVPPVAAMPSFGSDDDDPSVARRLGLVPMSAPQDASEITEDEA